jgi:hypothetical protein
MRWRALIRASAGVALTVLIPIISTAGFDSRVVTSPEALPGAQFGYSVAGYGDYAVVGVPGTASMSGSVYLLHRNAGGDNNWGQLEKFTASDPAAGDQFGYSVAIYGDWVLVGAPGKDLAPDTDAGKIYIFYRHALGTDMWGQRTSMTSQYRQLGARFGHSVALYSAQLSIGSPEYGGGRGIVENYYLSGTTWYYRKGIVGSDANDGDRFGTSISLYGSTLAASAPYDADPDSSTGSVYVFSQHRDGTDVWGQVAKLQAPVKQAGAEFGGSLKVRVTTLVIGAPGEDAGIGASYVFSKDQGGTDKWGILARIVNPDGAPGDRFGSTVSVNGAHLLCGAFAEGDSAGAAYLFYQSSTGVDGWDLISRTTSAIPSVGNRFGQSLDISGNYLLIASPGDDTAADEAGAVEFQAFGTPVSEVSGKTVWTAENNPYRITANMTLADGDTLEIGPGTVVLIDSDRMIDVYGVLRVMGEEANPVWLHNGSSSEWGGIHVHSDSSEFHHAIMKAADADRSSPNDRGGAIRVSAGASVLLDHCTLTENRSAYGGGALAVTEKARATLIECELTSNTTTSAAFHGGAIYIATGGHVTIEGGKVSSNILDAASQSGGAIAMSDSSTLLMIDVAMQSNSVTSVGGGLYMDGGTATLRNCYLSSNYASGAGGAIEARNDADLWVEDCRINYNRTYTQAGAINLSTGANAWFLRTEFITNRTEYYGGAFGIASSATALVSGCSFENNYTAQYSDRRGGAFWISNGSLDLVNSTVNLSRSYNGGAMWIEASSNVAVTGCQFKENKARDTNDNYGEGGVVYITTSTDVLFEHTDFIGNRAYDYGGVVRIVQNAHPVFNNCEFRGNSANDGGGAIYLYGLNPGDCSVELNDCRLYSNSSSVGGGIYSNCNPIKIRGTVFSGNSASSEGGAISLSNGGSRLDMENSILQGNTSSSHGSAVRTSYSSSIRVVRCTIVGNKSTSTSTSYYSFYSSSAGSYHVNSSIIWGNSPRDTECTAGISYSILGWGCTSAGGNMSTNPMLIDAGGGDVHLKPGSPAINAGDPALPIDPDSTRADIGAYIFRGSVFLPEVVAPPGSLLVVGIRATAQQLRSVDLAFTFPDSVMSPADPFLLSTAFDGKVGVSTDYSITGGRITIAVAADDTVNLNDELLVRLAFIVHADADVSVTAPLEWDGDHTALDEAAPASMDGLVRVGPVYFGDVSEDGSLTALDASLILKHMVGKIDPDSLDLQTADVTGNGGISSMDAALVMTKVLNSAYIFPIQGGGISKVAARSETLTWTHVSGGWALHAGTAIVSGNLVLALSAESKIDVTAKGLVESRASGEDLRIAFTRNPGEKSTELFTIVGVGLEETPVVTSSVFNEGTIRGNFSSPQAFCLGQNVPNPFNPLTSIGFTTVIEGPVSLVVHNTTGQIVKRLVTESLPAGRHAVIWNGTDFRGRDVASGVYFCRLRSSEGVRTRRMLLVR